MADITNQSWKFLQINWDTVRILLLFIFRILLNKSFPVAIVNYRELVYDLKCIY